MLMYWQAWRGGIGTACDAGLHSLHGDEATGVVSVEERHLLPATMAQTGHMQDFHSSYISELSNVIYYIMLT